MLKYLENKRNLNISILWFGCGSRSKSTVMLQILLILYSPKLYLRNFPATFICKFREINFNFVLREIKIDFRIHPRFMVKQLIISLACNENNLMRGNTCF
jgi:hypothetical protein